jgi:predicted small secreted protein
MNKIRQTLLLAILIVTGFVLTACNLVGIRGSGNVVEETREVSGVSGVNLATIGDLTIEVGDTESFRIEAEDNLMEYFETEVRGGKLRIDIQNNVRVEPTRPVRYYLTVTDLDTIDISSSGNIEAPDLEVGEFSITVGSSGNLEMGDLVADTLTVRISSSGDVTMGELNAEAIGVDMGSSGNLAIAGGEIKSQDITIGSSGIYTAQDLASDKADVRLSSSGSATIWVRDQLKANLSSSGDVRYRGNPTVDATTSSSGDVIHIGE